MSSGQRRNKHPAFFVALGVLLFVGVFAVVQWVLDPLGEKKNEPRAVAVDPSVGAQPSAVTVVAPVASLPVVVPVAPVAPGAAVAKDGDTEAAPHEGRQCRIAVSGDSPVARACAAGGIEQAKKVMKRLVMAAKANGVVFGCDSCHEVGGTENDLLGDARDKFRTLVASARIQREP